MPPALGLTSDLCLFCYLVDPGEVHPLHHDPPESLHSLQVMPEVCLERFLVLSALAHVGSGPPGRSSLQEGIDDQCTQHSTIFFSVTLAL